MPTQSESTFPPPRQPLIQRLAPLWGTQGYVLLALVAAVALAWHLPVESPRFQQAIQESLALTQWYAREHIILCLVPAFFIAGAIGALVSQGAITRYLGSKAHPVVAYGVASCSGTLLAVCSCTVLPLFAAIWRRGAGLGPAAAFLYSGPAINVLAIILTARVLGLELGVARGIFAVVFSVVIGLCMAWIFAREEAARQAPAPLTADGAGASEPVVPRGTLTMLAAMMGILIFANWGAPEGAGGFWAAVAAWRWTLVIASALVLVAAMVRHHGVSPIEAAVAGMAVAGAYLLAPHQPIVPFLVGTAALALLASGGSDSMHEWLAQSWDFAVKILPLLLAGVLVAGFLLGRPGHEGMIPSPWIEYALGGNSISANVLASFAGALMYFATLTEVPILQGLMGSGMGKGPALALLLAGPALSLPNMIVIRSVMGTKRMLVFVGLVVVLAALSGIVYGAFAG